MTRLSYGLSAAGSISLAANLGTCGDQSVCSIPQTWLSMINDGDETTNVAGCLAQQNRGLFIVSSIMGI
jgi:hypothetical protein